MPNNLITFENPLDMTGHQVRNHALHVSSVAPSAPTFGQLYYDNVLNTLRIWTGSWVTVASQPSGNMTVPGNLAVTGSATVGTTLGVTGQVSAGLFFGPGAGLTPLADHFNDVATAATNNTEETIYTDTLTAGILANNADKISAEYSGVLAQHATASRQLRVYFGGTKIFDSTALVTNVANAGFCIRSTIIRVSSSVVRCMTTIAIDTASFLETLPAQYLPVTGLTLANTQIIKLTALVTGTGAAAADVTGKLAHVIKFHAAGL